MPHNEEKNFATGVGEPIQEVVPPAHDPSKPGGQALPFNFFTGVGEPIDEVIPPADPSDARVINPLRFTPGTVAALEHEAQKDRVSFAENIALGFEGLTAIAPAIRKWDDENGLLGLFGFREEGTAYDKQAFADTLDPGITREQKWEILSEDTLEGAMRHKARVIDELIVTRKLANQGLGMGLAQMLGGIADVDAVFLPFTGGSLKAARIAQQSYRIAKSARLTDRFATRVGSAAVALSAGAQAGAVVGLVEQGVKETATWEDFAMLMLGSTAMSGVIGTALHGSRSLITPAQNEFLDRIRTDRPNLRDELDVEKWADDGADAMPDLGLKDEIDEDALVIGGKKPESVGAASLGAGGRPKRVLDDPAGPIAPDEAAFIDKTDEWAHESDFNDKKQRDERTAWIKVITSKLGSIGTEDFTRLYTSGASTLNWLGGVVFESPSGLNRGRATSATRMENYHRRMMKNIGWHIDPLVRQWAKDTNNTWAGSGFFVSRKGYEAFSRELMLEMSDRAQGRKSERHGALVEAADRYEAAGAEGRKIGRGGEGQRSIDGAEDWADRRGWTPYAWSGAQIEALMHKGVRRIDIEKALAEGYRSAGMLVGVKDARAVARAVIQRAIARSGDQDMSVLSLLTGDGREFMRGSLSLTAMTKDEIDALMDRLTGSLEERSKPGFAKHRNELDMNISIKNSLGEDIKLVDLLDNDMAKTWQKYTRQLSGAAALARVGITNKAQRQTFINAAHAEQRALGEKVMDGDLLKAMFTHFDGGPVHGFAAGKTDAGISPIIAIAKRIANLGLLEKLGLTQLGETGASVGRLGMKIWFERGPLAERLSEMKAGRNAGLLDDLSYIIGEIGRDERVYGEWKDLDEISQRDRGKWMEFANRFSGNAALVQSYTSFFNTVRRHQQKIAVMGIVDKVMRGVKKEDYSSMLARFENDLGLGAVELRYIESLVADGTIEFDPRGFVNKVNFDKWDVEMAEVFGSAIVRNMNQIVQKSMAGEQSAWMHTDWGSVMTHLMTFPMAAFQKQFMANMRTFDGQSMGTLLFGMSTAMMAVSLRDILDGRDRSLEDQAMRAFSYNNMTGWVPMVVDPVMTILGLDDYRMNPYGPYADITPPVISQWNNLRRAPGALIKGLVGGDEDYYDRQAKKALPFAGTYLFSRMFDKAQKPKKEPKRKRGLSKVLADPGVSAAIKSADARKRGRDLSSILANPGVDRAIKAADRKALDGFLKLVLEK